MFAAMGDIFAGEPAPPAAARPAVKNSERSAGQRLASPTLQPDLVSRLASGAMPFDARPRLDQFYDGARDYVLSSAVAAAGAYLADDGSSMGAALQQVGEQDQRAAAQAMDRAVRGTAGPASTQAPAPWQRAQVLDCPAFDAYMLASRNTRTPEHGPRQALLQFYDQTIAPGLRSEESALQMIAMELAYIHLCRDDQFDVRIADNFDNESVTSFALRYHVSQPPLVDSSHGMTAFVLEPVYPQDAHCAALVLFRGTVASVRLGMSGPRGIRADADTAGIGATAFAANQEALLGWVNSCFENGRQQVVVVGHSLGGAYATRLMAAAPTAMQRQMRLMTFNAPGVGADVCCCIEPQQNNVVRIAHAAADFVSDAGESHPPGRGVFVQEYFTTTQSGDLPHTIPYIVIRELRDERPFYETGDSGVANHLAMEMWRGLLANIGARYLPI